MRAGHSLTVDDVIGIIFQRPDRITKNMFEEQLAPHDVSLDRARQELWHSGQLRQDQAHHVIGVIVELGPQLLADYLEMQHQKLLANNRGGDPVEWGYVVQVDNQAFLGVSIMDETSGQRYPIHPGNDCAQWIEAEMRRELRYVFPDNMQGVDFDTLDAA